MKVVGIGASAGGVEAVCDFLESLPGDTGAAFVIIQQLSSNSGRVMNELAKRNAGMPVILLEQSTQPAPNKIYLVPGDKTVSYSEGMLVVEQRTEDQQMRLPIDNFFHSLGQELNKDAIAVVLSGIGTDGSRGVRTIKGKGGVVLVQNPEGAKPDDMPRAVIRLNLADGVLPVRELAQKVSHIARYKDRENGRSSLFNFTENGARACYERILKKLHKHTGVDLAAYQEETLIRRIENRMLLQYCDTPEAYYYLLSSEDGEASTLFNDMLTGITQFFGDAETFKMLAETIIPALVENQPDNRPLRIWIPACSTGEEAYTIAMLLDDYLQKTRRQLAFKIFASDIDRIAISTATDGFFPAGISADIPPDLLNRYFVPETNGYRASTHLREKILFAVHDVLHDPPFVRMNMISCRNFLIYIKNPIQYKTLTTFHFALHDKGVLFLGPGESLGEVKNAFTTISRKYNFHEKLADLAG